MMVPCALQILCEDQGIAGGASEGANVWFAITVPPRRCCRGPAPELCDASRYRGLP
jgi:hypothetical protein